MLTALLDDHRHIAARARRLEALALGPDVPDFCVMSSIHWAFAQEVTQHVVAERKLLGMALHMMSAPAGLAPHREAWLRPETFEAPFKDYASWTAERMNADLPGFREATIAILARLRARAALEEDDIYPMVMIDRDEPASPRGYVPARHSRLQPVHPVLS